MPSPQIYLAIRYKGRPDWELRPYDFAKDTLQAVKMKSLPVRERGKKQTMKEWKILRELDFKDEIATTLKELTK